MLPLSCNMTSPALVEGNFSCETDLPHTARQNTDLEFGQAKPEPVKS